MRCPFFVLFTVLKWKRGTYFEPTNIFRIITKYGSIQTYGRISFIVLFIWSEIVRIRSTETNLEMSDPQHEDFENHSNHGKMYFFSSQFLCENTFKIIFFVMHTFIFLVSIKQWFLFVYSVLSRISEENLLVQRRNQLVEWNKAKTMVLLPSKGNLMQYWLAEYESLEHRKVIARCVSGNFQYF